MVNNFIPIPDWDPRGLLPPSLGELTSAASNPPYPVRLTELALHFADNGTRRQLLLGLLDFRRELHDAGITGGFQFVDGSFVENTLLRRGRDPADIDVVTFFNPPVGRSQSELLNSFPICSIPKTPRTAMELTPISSHWTMKTRFIWQNP